MYRYWKITEVSVLKENIKSMPLDDLALKLNRTKSSLIAFMHKNNIHNKKTWTKEDINYVIENKNKSYSEFAKHFGVTKTAFAQFLNSKKIKLKDERRKKKRIIRQASIS